MSEGLGKVGLDAFKLGLLDHQRKVYHGAGSRSNLARGQMGIFEPEDGPVLRLV